MKSRRRIWTGSSKYGGAEVFRWFWWGNLRERDHLGEPSVGGLIEKHGIIGSEMWGHGLDRAGLGKGQVAGTCGCGNEHLCSIKFLEFFD